MKYLITGGAGFIGSLEDNIDVRHELDLVFHRAMAARIAVTIAIAVVLTLPSSAFGRAVPLGINEEWTRAEPHLDDVAATGELLRVNLSWHRSEWSEPSAIYRALRERGMRPIFVLYGSMQPPPGRWTRFVAEATRRYPDAIFEVWNEPNLEGFWHEPPSPEAYARLFRRTHQAAAPNATLLTAGLAPIQITRPGRVIDWRAYLWALRSLGVTELADGVAYHVYPDHPWTVKRGGGVTSGSPKRLLGLGRRYAGVDEAWITELTASAMSGKRRQARRLERAIRSASRTGVRAVVIHRLLDTPGHEQYWRDAGMLERDGTPKLAAQAFRFPFVARSKKKRRVRVWGIAPVDGAVRIERQTAAGWDAIKTLRSRKRVFTGRVSAQSKAKLRATAGDQHSLAR